MVLCIEEKQNLQIFMCSFKEAFKKAAKPQKEFVVLLSVLRVTKGGSAQYVLVVFKI